MIDDHQLRELEVDLSRAPKRVRSPEGLRRATRHLVREFKVEAAGHRGSFFTPKKRHKKPMGLERLVSADILSDTRAEAGIEARGAGNLAPLLFFGAPGHPRIGNSPATPGSAPVASTKAVVDRSLPGILDDLADHTEESVLGRRGK